MSSMRKLALIIFGLFFPILTWAIQEKSNYFIFSDINVTGYIDTSYNYLLRNHQFISGVNDRVNDLTQNGFTLQQAAIIVSKQPAEGLGGFLNAFVGRDAYAIAPYGWNPYYGSQTLGFVVPQAYLQYGVNSFVLIGGLFDTLIGQENYNPTLDTNFSRSILDGYAEPGMLLGVRGNYTYDTKLKFNIGLNNGWSGLRDTGRKLTLELGGTYLFNPAFSFMLQALSGEQRLVARVAKGPTGRRDIINLIVTDNVTDNLSLIASGDYGIQRKGITPYGVITQTVWMGVSGYVNYKFNDTWRTAFRGEIYDDQDGYTTGVRQNWRELTWTVAFAPLKNLEFRAETRHDFSNVNSFMNATGPGASNNQQSYALEALYVF